MNYSEKKLRLGTRRSLLAWAQSSWVAREIERLNPGWNVELVGIDTRGDKILDVSLQSIQGKEFFVAELDNALREGHVDFTVHSMKDLSLDRPAEFVLGAVPKRENPRDILLFGPNTMKRLEAGEALKIGTSSPRRLENIPSFIEKALPQLSPGNNGRPRVDFVDIRGNVNTRLARVHETLGSERYLDGVVLAFAGLIRLWRDEAGRQELQKLLQGTRPMILPLKECPAAPAQGALAVECRAADAEIRQMLGKLHDPATEEAVKQERGLLAAWGGGCHQKFGATAVRLESLPTLLYIRGRKPDGEFVDELRWQASLPAPQGAVRTWDGSEHRSAAQHASEALKGALAGKNLEGQAVFVAHSRAVQEEFLSALRCARIWTSGTASWFKLAARGLWVEGCGDGFGFEQMKPIVTQGLLALPPFGQWVVLSHDAAFDGWKDDQDEGAQVIATYRVTSRYSEESRQALREATHVYWSSGSQFDALKAFAPAAVHHACGPGKTAQHLKKAGITPAQFPSSEEWKKWTAQKQA